MNRDEVWMAIDDQRRLLVALLEDLSEREWREPSLCAGWTVREAAAHVARQNTGWSELPRAVPDLIRSGGMAGAIDAAARRHARLPTGTIVAEIRDRIGVWRPLPTLTYRQSAIDYLVHAQDIALPLGRDIPMPADAAAVAADAVWRNGAMFHARRRFTGFRFVATDVAWAVGEGSDVTGPIAALLLVLTGRPTGLANLTGPGLPKLRAGLVSGTPRPTA
ncbi:maleylpyruvate isomerase family mycothiol-dependent enzyme [Nakamurella sp.]|uniref:maleylpyruvate isomerase family mycothiol-dependent enzyme n=1 Tax=Nakamurella sp. TaxID=1869182 RepID=UPI0037838FB6